MYYTNFDFIVDKAKAGERKIRVAIAGAVRAEAAGFAQLLLVGYEEKIT